MAQMNISLSQRDLDRIKEKARDSGLPTSAYVRKKALDEPWPPVGAEAGPPTREEFEGLNARVSEIERVAESQGAM